MEFNEFGLNESLLEALAYMNFEKATPIQEKAIPIILKNQDLIACAQTGTGKTAAFVLPILNKLVDKQDSFIDTLIIVPTRELAIQIEQQIQGLSYFISVGSKAVYGGGDGADWQEQKNALSEGVDIIVATPGKLLSHLKLGYVNFNKVNHLVLDEADRMLDMGFYDDLKTIMKYLPDKRQNLMFSATMPPNIRQLARGIMRSPAEISLAISKPAAGVTQRAVLVFDEQKDKVLTHVIEQRPEYGSILIFTSTKSKVSTIVRALRQAKLPARGISSNLEQDAREEVLRGFRSRRIRILVATDVMSRGIDIKEINLVINYDAPSDAEDYVHRIGRTARADTKGEAITLINPKDMPRIHRIERLIESEIPKEQPPEEIGAGPEWKAPTAKKKRRPNKHRKKNGEGTNRNRSGRSQKRRSGDKG